MASSPVAWLDVSGVHTVTAHDGSFDSSAIYPWETFALPPGGYPHFCDYHRSMQGPLVVT